MKILDEEERRDLLNDILKDLSKSQDVLSERKNRIDFFIRLESVYHSVGIRKATRSMKGIFPPLSSLLSLRVRPCTRRSSALKGGKYASSRLCDLTHRDFKGFQGR